MWCRQVRNQLSAYADGELSVSEARGIEEHLAACEQCARDHSSLQKLVRITAAIPAEELPSSLHGRIMMRLAYDAQPEPSRNREAKRVQMGLSMFNPWMWTAATGAAAALALGFFQQQVEKTDARPVTQRTVGVNATPVDESPRVEPARTREPRRIVGITPQASKTAVVPEGQASDTPQAGPGAGALRVQQVASAAGREAVSAKRAKADRTERVRPVEGSKPMATSTIDKATAEPLLDPPATAPLMTQGMLAVPGEPNVNSTAVVPQAELMMAGMEKDVPTRMAGSMPDGEMPIDEDEGVRDLRMFLEERNRTVPQPPAVNPNRDRRMRKL